MKILNGQELAAFVKERQAGLVAALREKNQRAPKLLIIRDSDSPVILKYVELKKQYGDDIGVAVEDYHAKTPAELKDAIKRANVNPDIDAMIVQLPLETVPSTALDEVLSLIAAEKDVDGLSGVGRYDSATATAINWLLSGYDIRLAGRKIAIVGKGRLVGAPLYKMWQNSGLDLKVFHRGDDLRDLVNYSVIVTATGSPQLIKSEMVSAGTVLVDAGTASENGILMGDVDEALRERDDLTAITPKVGGVGPLTVSVLFENVINAA